MNTTIKNLNPILGQELFTRLEEQGSTQVGDEFSVLAIKLINDRKGIPLSLTDKERKELAHHCTQIIEIAAENNFPPLSEYEKRLQQEGRLAQNLLAKLQ